ncbi:glycosyltransferase family 4 protein [Candidatus Gottesmanbacteria bacterium]|nr:glycosyltransferase family 4 protein [Candidatus Gottesmanbacteria bacterium]
MKIAIDISQIVYQGSGVATYTRNLISSLLSVDKKNEYILFGVAFHQMNILEQFHSEMKKIHNGVSKKFIFLPPSVINFVWNSLHILPVDIFLPDIDIFHSSDWIQPPTKAVKITTVHDVIPLKYPETSSQYIVDTQKKRLGWVQKEVDCIISDSYSTKEDITRILKVSDTIVHVIYPGVSNDFQPQSKQEIERVKQKYSLFDDYVLSVGIVEPRKNLKTLIAAFLEFERHPLIKAMRKPLELVIVGNPGWGEKISSSKYVRTLGFVEQRDLPALFSGARVFVYPSLYEGFGLPILEAMACGCPVIASNRGSLKELVKDHALIIDPTDSVEISQKLVQLIVDSDLRTNLIKDTSGYVARFNWNSHARKVIHLYEMIGKRQI